MALTPIEQVRLIIADNENGLYILSDDEIQFYIDQANGNVNRAAIGAARTVLLKLAQRGEESVDIFSIKGSKAASEYRLALQLFIKDPNLNALSGNLKGWFGGISRTEMILNDANLDNNIIESPTQDRTTIFTGCFIYPDRYNV